jgi:hypothetical protein
MLGFLRAAAKRSAKTGPAKASGSVKVPISTKSPVRSDPRERWRAVAIVAPSTACAAALACKGKRFLCREAPRLPLADCGAQRCDCKYRHLPDRRGGPRRADEKGAIAARVNTNRRNTRDRRAAE